MGNWKSPVQLQLTHFQSTHLCLNKQKPHEINYKQIAWYRSIYVPAILMVCVVLFSEFANAVPRKWEENVFEKWKINVYFRYIGAIQSVALRTEMRFNFQFEFVLWPHIQCLFFCES